MRPHFSAHPNDGQHSAGEPTVKLTLALWLLEEVLEYTDVTTAEDEIDALLDLFGVVVMALQTYPATRVKHAAVQYLRSQVQRNRPIGLPHEQLLSSLLDMFEKSGMDADAAVFDAISLRHVSERSRKMSRDQQIVGMLRVLRLSLRRIKDEVKSEGG